MSVEFHERGKRHQENVQLRLKDIRKRSYEKSLEEDETAKQMEKLEKAALKAFKKDLKNNPELAAQYGVSLEPKPKVEKAESSECEASNTDDTKKEKKKKVKEWYETKSPEGYSYYWSTLTGVTKWDPPKDYVTLAEQEAEQKAQEIEASKEQEAKEVITREDKPSSRSAFGSWNVVREEITPDVKLYDETSEAPALDDIPLPEVKTQTEIKPVKEKFKEKTVASLGSSSSGSVTFKKRKIASGARNVRQRDDDD